MNVYAIVAGGPSFYYPDLLSFKKENIIWVGVDRGVHYLLQKGLKPSIAFGDFDSLTKKEREYVFQNVTNIHRYPKDKDATDLELALEWVVAREPAQILIFGATGGRLDHALINLQLLVKSVRSGREVLMIDKQNIVTVKEPGTYMIEKFDDYQYISFLPYTKKVHELTLQGVKYPLNKQTIERGSSLCISNEMVRKRVTISFSDGLLIIVQSKDEKQ